MMLTSTLSHLFMLFAVCNQFKCFFCSTIKFENGFGTQSILKSPLGMCQAENRRLAYAKLRFLSLGFEKLGNERQ